MNLIFSQEEDDDNNDDDDDDEINYIRLRVVDT